MFARCSFEGPALFEAFAEEEEGDGDEQNAHGNGCAERPVVSCAEQTLHNVGDHGAGRSADKKRSEEVTEGKNESESGSGEEAGHGKRKDDTEKCFGGTGAEILRGFDEWARDVFERRVDGEEDERRVDVREDEDDRERAVEEKADRFMRDVKILEKTVEDAVAAKDGFPRIAANEIADPEWNDDELIEEFFACAGMEGEIVRKRIAEEERQKRNGSRDAHGAEKNFRVDGIGEKCSVVGEITLMDNEAVANGPEAVREHERVGEKKEEANPQEWREGDDRFVGAGVHSVLSC